MGCFNTDQLNLSFRFQDQKPFVEAFDSPRGFPPGNRFDAADGPVPRGGGPRGEGGRGGGGRWAPADRRGPGPGGPGPDDFQNKRRRY